MNFKSMNELKLWIKCHKMYNFDGGSQGECFKIGDKVYKIFIQYIEEEYIDIITYNKDDIMQFSHIVNNTYIWPNDIIMVGDMVVGYIMDYIDARSLCNINPLYVNLDKFESFLEKADEDIKVISNNGVKTFDVMYNIMYGKNGFKVIDSVEYSLCDMDSAELFKINSKNFYYEIRLFLTYGYFDEFIFNYNHLYRMCNDTEVKVLDFLKEFRRILSENEGFEITKLGDAKKSVHVKKIKNLYYVRNFV